MSFPLHGATDLVPLTGGTNHSGWLATLADGRRVAVKITPDMPADLFETEAEGLIALGAGGRIATPEVIAVGADHLVLAAVAPAPDLDDLAFWAEAGRRLADLHADRGERFGWHRDNWLGLVRQVNTWTDDAYEFFVQHRVLRYLTEPRVEAALDRETRAGVERICARLPDLVPAPYPALTHGDLWHGNFMATDDGRPVLIDPSVSWSWPEVDISMMFCAGSPVPDRFFAAYHEIMPTDGDWRERARLLHLRELLSVMAHPGVEPPVPQVLDLVRRYG